MANTLCDKCGERTQDVFVHYSAIKGLDHRRSLAKAQYVEFEILEGDKGPIAHNVRVVKPEGQRD